MIAHPVLLFLIIKSKIENFIGNIFDFICEFTILNHLVKFYLRKRFKKIIDLSKNNMSNKIILIITDKISDRAILISKLWQNSGFTTIALYSQENLLFSDKSYFNFHFKMKSSYQILYVSTIIESKILHYFSYGIDRIGVRLSQSTLDYIYDYKDLFGNTITDGKISEKFKIIEKKIVSNSKFITRRDNQIFNYINRNNIEYERNNIYHVPEYFISDEEYENILYKNCCAEKLDYFKIVMSGGYLNSDIKNKILYEGIDRVMLLILKQGIQLHVVGGFSNDITLMSRLNVAKFQHFLDIGLLKVLPSMPQRDFELILLNYDFALHMFNCDVGSYDYSIQFDRTNHLQYCGSARVYSFIKANLPIITGKSLKYILHEINNANFILEFDDMEIKNLKKSIISKFNRKQEIIRMKQRHNYSFDNSLDRFKSTYDDIFKKL